MLVAMIVLGSVMGAPLRVDEALETLSKCQDFQNEGCRFAGAWLKMGGDAAMPQVLEKTPRMTRIGQILVVTVLGTNPSKPATDTLGKLAKDTRVDEVVRALALDQLSGRTLPPKMKGGPLEVAMSLVNDGTPAVRQGAVRVVAKNAKAKDKKLMGVLETAAADQDPGVRSEAMVGYANCGCEDSASVLKKGLKDPDANVRRSAVDGFAQIRHPQVVPDLVAMLNPRDDVMNRSLSSALRFQTGKSFDDAQEWRRWLADSRN